MNLSNYFLLKPIKAAFGKIPRGRIYHSFISELHCLFAACFTNLGEQKSVENFELAFAKYTKRNFCIAFPYARTALYFGLQARGLKTGDEIIMPPITIKAMLDVVLDLGLTPIFVDIDPDTFCFDEGDLKNAISSNTRAILITYLFGMVPDIPSLLKPLRERNIFIIEDFSQCLNGSYQDKLVGSFGDLGIYSASSTKQLDLFGGGLAICDDETLANKLQKFQSGLRDSSRLDLIKKIYLSIVRNLATSPAIFDLVTYPIIGLISRFSRNKTIKFVGERDQSMVEMLPKTWFHKFTSLQANYGCKLLPRIKNLDELRINNASIIKLKLSSYLRFPETLSASRNIYWQLILYVKDPALAQSVLRNFRIDSATSSLIQISDLRKYPFQKPTPNANKLLINGLFIPSFSFLSADDVERISNALEFTRNDLQ